MLVRTWYLGIVHLRFHTTLELKCTSIHRYWYIKFEKLGYIHRGLPSMARLALGPSGLDPGLELRPRTAALRQHIRLLLPAQAYISRQEDLHEDANARFHC
jgi:hypothetical protein